MMFHPLHKLLNSVICCFFHNCMWQSWYSEVNVYLLHLGGLLSTHGSLSVLVWSSSSIFTGIDTQLWIDFDPSTCLSVLVECLMSSWPNGISFWISWVSPFLIIGFLVWVGFAGCLFCFERLLNPILSSNYLWRESLVVVAATHLLSYIWFLQIPSQHFSRCNKLGVYRKGWLRSNLFDRTSILYDEQAVHRPNTPYLGAFSTSACAMQDVVWSNHSCGSLWYSWGFTAVKNTVCELVMECKLTAHPIW